MRWSRGRRKAPSCTRRFPVNCAHRCTPASRFASPRPGVLRNKARTRRGAKHKRRELESSTMRLRSYAQGEWVEGAGKATELFHAVTGEKVAEATSEGLA